MQGILTIRFLLNGVKSESSGKFKTYREMPWGEVYLRQFDGRCIKRLAFSYGNRPGDFRAIMEHISAIPVKHGDIAYEVEIFPEYKIQMILWEAMRNFRRLHRFSFLTTSLFLSRQRIWQLWEM